MVRIKYVKHFIGLNYSMPMIWRFSTRKSAKAFVVAMSQCRYYEDQDAVVGLFEISPSKEAVEIVEAAEREVEALRKKGWTRADFARELGKMLGIDSVPK